MKKLILIAVLIVATLAMFAGTPRVYQQKVTLTDGSMPGPPTNTLPIPGYVLSAFVANAEGPISPVYNVQSGNLCIKRTGPSTGYFVVAYVNQSIFANNWLPGTGAATDANPDGRWLDLTLTHTASGEFLHWTKVIPNGAGPMTDNAVPMIAPPFPVADTWNYNLHFTVPAGEYTISHDGAPGVGAPYNFADADDLEPNLLLGSYEISAAPTGFHWLVNPIAIVADDFIALKANIVKNATKTFELAADPVLVITPADPAVIVVANGLPEGVILDATVSGASASYPEAITMDVYYPSAPAPELGAGMWSGWIFYSGTWHAAANNVLVGPGRLYFPGVVFTGGKSVQPILFREEPNLPVEFSSFAATLTAQNFVKLTWVTETETGVSGYNVYRSTDADQATAVQINSALIDATNTSQTATYTHVDNEVSAQTTYSYWLEIVEMDGTTAFHGPTTVYVENAPVNDAPVLVTTMENAYPNPFKANTSTSIPVKIKDGETGTLTIYNIIGQVVKTVSVKGKTDISWNGRDSKNNACGSGIYFYKLSTPSRNVTKKMVIVN